MIDVESKSASIEAKKQYLREWRLAHKEEIAAKRKAKYEANRTKPPRSRQSKESLAAKQKIYYQKRAEELREYAREYRKNLPPEIKLANSRKGKAAYRVKRDAEMALKAGRPRAVVCETPSCFKTGAGRSKDAKTVFDHDHVTGEFRGWLCNRCNVIAGLAEDDPQVLRELADYLDRHNAKRLASAA